ncbi:MAG: HAD family phosphatase [Cyclobacteriaceae bacterium]|nr:HAD family phosphatase [Cyclobacteriaceae bacterium]
MKGIIFDQDGTMIDNMMVHHRAWQRILKELGLDMLIEEVMEKVHGINEEILQRLFGDKYTLEERQRISREKEAEYREIYRPQLKLVDGLDIFLKEAKANGILMGVATAAPPENMDFVLDGLNIRDLFKTTLNAHDVKRGKPDPEVYLKAARALDLEPTECIVFEDSPTGARSAFNAGIPVIVVKTTHKEKDFEGIPVLRFINDFTEISFERTKSETVFLN